MINKINGNMHMIIISLLLLSFASNSYSNERVDVIEDHLKSIESNNEINASVSAQEALSSEDPLERSIILEKVLSNKFPRVRAIGLKYLIEVQKRIIIEATITEDSLKNVQPVDKDQLLGALTITVNFENFDPKTARVKYTAEPGGGGEGMVGLDGLTLIGWPKINLKTINSGYLIGVASYRLNNSAIPVEVPIRAALP